MDDAARQLVTDHLELARSLGRKASRHMPTVWRDDIRSAAYEGLLAAAIKYRPDMGASFPTYASRRIQWAIIDERRHLFTGRRSARDLMDQALLDPWDQDPVYNKRTDRRHTSSLDRRPSTSNPFANRETKADRVAAPGANPADVYAADHDAADEVKALRFELSPRDRRLVRMYYYEQRTLRAIGIIEKISEARVSQLLTELRARLRRTNLHRKDHE